MEAHHPAIYNQCLKAERDGVEVASLVKAMVLRSQADFFQSRASSTSFFTPEPRKRDERADRQLVLWCTKYGIPFDAVSKPEFVEYLKLHPLKPPSARDLRRKFLPQVYEQAKSIIASKFAAGKYVSVTADAWTDVTMNPWIGVTTHFVSDEFEVQSMTLDVVPAEGSQTAENIAQTLNRVIDEQIPDHCMVVSVTTDGEASFRKASRLIVDSDTQHCFCHQLDLVVRTALANSSAASKDVNDVQAIVTQVRASASLSSALERAQPKGRALRLKQCVPTRWASQYKMLLRFCRLYGCLVEVSQTHSFDCGLSACHMRRVQGYIDVLKPFAEFSYFAEGTSSVAIACIPPWIDATMAAFSDAEGYSGPDPVQVLRHNILAQMKERFAPILTFEKNYHLPLAACAFHPDFGSLAFVSPAVRDRVWTYLREQVDVIYDGSAEKAAVSRALLPALRSFLEDRGKPPVIDVLKPSFSCPVAMWRSSPVFCDLFHGLWDFASVFLGMQCTSVASEQMFSSAGFLKSSNRASMNADTMRKLVVSRSAFRDRSVVLT